MWYQLWSINNTSISYMYHVKTKIQKEKETEILAQFFSLSVDLRSTSGRLGFTRAVGFRSTAGRPDKMRELQMVGWPPVDCQSTGVITTGHLSVDCQSTDTGPWAPDFLTVHDCAHRSTAPLGPVDRSSGIGCGLFWKIRFCCGQFWYSKNMILISCEHNLWRYKGARN